MLYEIKINSKIGGCNVKVGDFIYITKAIDSRILFTCNNTTHWVDTNVFLDYRKIGLIKRATWGWRFVFWVKSLLNNLIRIKDQVHHLVKKTNV